MFSHLKIILTVCSLFLTANVCAMQTAARQLSNAASLAVAQKLAKPVKPIQPIRTKFYESHFTPPTENAEKILRNGKIIEADEQPHQMVERIVDTIAGAEQTYKKLYTQKMMPTARFAEQLGTLMDEQKIIFNTTILTNAGRFKERPLSACAMPPLDVKADYKKLRQLADHYHQNGMGTGYNLSDAKDPVTLLKYLNDGAVAGARSNKEQRPVGNMAILDVDSPEIEAFIMAKVGADARGQDWKFNISVNITPEFMDAVNKNKDFVLRNNKKVNAKELFNKMAYAAHQCGDPGLISLSRLNDDNPTPLVGLYQTTAPCAEVGLLPGETCTFGYINLAKFVTKSENPELDFQSLQSTVSLLTRALDNVVEISNQKFSVAESRKVMEAKRKIGIGICGFADMLIALNLSYTQPQARDMLQDILNFISYHSKVASHELAQERGSFGAFLGSRYTDESFILNKYGGLNTPHVSATQWSKLATTIKETMHLRNATTTALPPTGRSAQVIEASTGIEPLFTLNAHTIQPAMLEFLRKHTCDDAATLAEIKQTGRFPKSITVEHPFITATEITPADHLAMTAAAATAIDESISKTVNMPEHATVEDIASIYKDAFAAGLKGVTIYRDNSRTAQPQKLSKDISTPEQQK